MATQFAFNPLTSNFDLVSVPDVFPIRYDIASIPRYSDDVTISAADVVGGIAMRADSDMALFNVRWTVPTAENLLAALSAADKKVGRTIGFIFGTPDINTGAILLIENTGINNIHNPSSPVDAGGNTMFGIAYFRVTNASPGTAAFDLF